jgi:hypothetical protein
MTPAGGSYLADVKVDGTSVGAVLSYTFTNVVADHSIAATFEPGSSYIITSSAGQGGSISPLGPVAVKAGGSVTFTITPNSGYTINSVNVDGTSLGPVSTYTFNNVAGPHTIFASFTLISYTITASAGANGQISPAGPIVVQYGGSRTFTITANAGYRVYDVLVDGQTVGAVLSYTFSNVVASHTIVASFASGTSHTITASAGTGGTISPVGPVAVVDGGNQLFTITPGAGYKMADVLVDGVSVGAQT